MASSTRSWAVPEPLSSARRVAGRVPYAGSGMTQRSDAIPTLPPTLGWILHHVPQEHTPHRGHLDVTRERIDRAVGEYALNR